MKIGLLELLMGVETPIPPKMINAAAPDGAPPRRIKTVEIIICRFSWLGCEPDRFMRFLQSKTVRKKTGNRGLKSPPLTPALPGSP